MSKKPDWRMQVNSGGVIPHGHWGNLSIDMAGLNIERQDLPALRDHDAAKPVGFTTKIWVEPTGELMAEGMFSSTEYGDEVKTMMSEGFPMQASMYVPSDEVERVAKGDTKLSNGHAVEGPGHIFRASRLREVTFTTLGADSNTHAVALAEDGSFNSFADAEKAMYTFSASLESLSMDDNTPEEVLEIAEDIVDQDVTETTDVTEEVAEAIEELMTEIEDNDALCKSKQPKPEAPAEEATEEAPAEEEVPAEEAEEVTEEEETEEVVVEDEVEEEAAVEAETTDDDTSEDVQLSVTPTEATLIETPAEVVADRDRFSAIFDAARKDQFSQVAELYLSGASLESAFKALLEDAKTRDNDKFNEIKDETPEVSSEVEGVEETPAEPTDPIQAAWDNNENNVQSTFSNFEVYKAYVRGVESGRIRP